MMRVIIATKNKGKSREIKKILKGIKLPIVSLEGLARQFRIREDGKTFLDNALKKAMAVSAVYKSDYVVGEDSGLEVDCLKGGPGVFSKRYSGKNSNDLKNNRKLLKKLKDVGASKRRAHFRCCVALVNNSQLIKTFEGKLTGSISKDLRGKRGFGYDPVFYLKSYKKTVAQLSLTEKNKISHRSKAFHKLKKYLYADLRKSNADTRR